MVLTEPCPLHIHHFSKRDVSSLKSDIPLRIAQHCLWVSPSLHRPRTKTCILEPFGLPTYPGIINGFCVSVNSFFSSSVNSAVISRNLTRFRFSFFSHIRDRLHTNGCVIYMNGWSLSIRVGWQNYLVRSQAISLAVIGRSNRLACRS